MAEEIKKSRIYKGKNGWVVWVQGRWGYVHPSWREALCYLQKVMQGWPNRLEDILKREKAA